MKNRFFTFTVDDNIRFLREITETRPRSLFEHPYLALYKKLHERFGLKVQLNLFFEEGDFDLSMVTDAYRDEWRSVSDWLKLSFHSRLENVKPYEFSGYDEVYADCAAVHREIPRFASEESLGRTTTVHYCRNTAEGLAALKDNGVEGLLGLYGTDDSPRLSYQTTEEDGVRIRHGELVPADGITYGSIDIVLNLFSPEEIAAQLTELAGRETIKVMIHEQYFYPSYVSYQPNFEEKLVTAFSFFEKNGYESRFFEELL